MTWLWGLKSLPLTLWDVKRQTHERHLQPEYVIGIRPGSFMRLDDPHLSINISKRDSSKSFTLCRTESGINNSARNAANRSELSKSDSVLPESTFSLDGNRSCCHIIIKVSQMRSSPILHQMLNKDCLILTCISAAILLLEWGASKWHRGGLFLFSFKTSGNSSRSLQRVFPQFSS